MASETEKELYKLVGKYEAQSEATQKHLESIDKRLEKGDKSMQDLDSKIERNFAEQKLTVSQCQGEQNRKHDDMQREIKDLQDTMERHKQKPHIYHQTGTDGRFTRLKRHWLEIILGAILTALAGGGVTLFNASQGIIW